jgi:hypothetical protein
MILDGLGTDRDLNSVAHELRVALHLSNKGWDLEFPDIEGSGAADILARKDSLVLEIQAKHFDIDTGEKVHRDDARLVLNEAIKTAQPIESGRAIIVVSIEVYNRVPRTREFLSSLCFQVNNCIRAAGRYEGDSFRVMRKEITDFGDRKSLSVDEKIAELVDDLKSNSKSFIMVRKQGDSAIVYTLNSSSDGNKKKYISDSIAECGSLQFSGERPGIIWAHLAGVSADDIKQMLSPPDSSRVTGVEDICIRAFKNSARNHVAGIIFSGDAEIFSGSKPAAKLKRQRSISQSGSAVKFTNMNSKYAAQDILRLVVD